MKIFYSHRKKVLNWTDFIPIPQCSSIYVFLGFACTPWMLHCYGFLSCCRHPIAVVQYFLLLGSLGLVVFFTWCLTQCLMQIVLPKYIDCLCLSSPWLRGADSFFSLPAAAFKVIVVSAHISVYEVGNPPLKTFASHPVLTWEDTVENREMLLPTRDAPSYGIFKWTLLFSAVPMTQYPCASRRWSQVSKTI